jgi:putative phosphoribosyl transferase
MGVSNSTFYGDAGIRRRTGVAHQLTVSKTEQTVRIPLNDGALEGNLTLPESAQGAVLFGFGGGSSRFNLHNRFVAESLHDIGVATLLVDLLTQREAREVSMWEPRGQARFDISRLAARLLKAADWLGENPATRDLPMGYFGANAGVAAALVAAAGRPSIAAVVSRGGRPDLAGGALREVTAAVLLIVSGRDLSLIDVNELAYEQLVRARDKSLHIVEHATHLFEEREALEEVARHSAEWFAQHL